MRVVLIASAAPDYCVEYAEMLSNACEVLLIGDRDRIGSKKFPKDRLTVALYPWPRHREIRNLALLFWMRRTIGKWKPDIVHFLGENNVWLNLLPPLLGRTPIVTTVHDIDYHPGDANSRRVPRVFIEHFIHQSDFIIVHGEGLRSAAQDQLPVDPARIAVFPHLPLEYYSRLAAALPAEPRKGDRFNILFFGRIFQYKGLQYLAEAAPLVLEKVPSARFVVAGAGDESLLAALDGLPPGSVDLRNRFVPDEEAALLFKGADLLVLPYIEASQSGVLMVALPFGLPVVATSVGEIASAVETLRVGLVVPPRNSHALADAIIRLATDPQLRETYARNATAAAAQELSKPALAARASGMYADILASLGRGPGSGSMSLNPPACSP